LYILPQWELALSCIPQNAHKRPSYFCQSAALNNTGAFQANTTNQNMSAAFGEWALLDSEVVPVQNIMQKYNWTQTALHHHMLGESPKILFLHWSVTGNAN
jgi:hypothetical protein